jgi:hypothetical protein
VLRLVAEPRDRAIHGRRRDVLGADAEAWRNTRPKSLEDDIGPRAQRSRKRGVGGQLADDRLAPGAERRIPAARGLPHRVAGRWFDADDTRAEARELAARVRTRQVAREVDDERVRERLHVGGG